MIPVNSQIVFHNPNRSSSVVQLLYHDIAKYKPLSKVVERDLIAAGQSGNVNAKNKVIYSNMRFAISMAKRYANKDIPLEDAISEALMGLLKAFESYDLNKDVKFITHAAFQIQYQLSLMQQGIVKLPNTYRILRKKIRTTQSKLEQEHCGDIPVHYLEEYLQLDNNQIRNYLYETVSLDAWFEKYEEELL